MLITKQRSGSGADVGRAVACIILGQLLVLAAIGVLLLWGLLYLVFNFGSNQPGMVQDSLGIFAFAMALIAAALSVHVIGFNRLGLKRRTAITRVFGIVWVVATLSLAVTHYVINGLPPSPWTSLAAIVGLPVVVLVHLVLDFRRKR